MEFLSALMLTLTATLVCLAFPRIYADWLSFRNLVEAGEYDDLRRLLAAENLWVQRHFWCALVAICMVVVVENTSLGTRAPHLAQVTAVYAAISLSLAFIESFFAQKVASLVAVEMSRRNSRTDYR